MSVTVPGISLDDDDEYDWFRASKGGDECIIAVDELNGESVLVVGGVTSINRYVVYISFAEKGNNPRMTEKIKDRRVERCKEYGGD